MRSDHSIPPKMFSRNLFWTYIVRVEQSGAFQSFQSFLESPRQLLTLGRENWICKLSAVPVSPRLVEWDGKKSSPGFHCLFSSRRLHFRSSLEKLNHEKDCRYSLLFTYVRAYVWLKSSVHNLLVAPRAFDARLCIWPETGLTPWGIDSRRTFVSGCTVKCNSGLPRNTSRCSGRVESLNPGHSDYNTSAKNHPATLPTFSGAFDLINYNHNGEFDQNCLKASQTPGCAPPPATSGGEP